MNLSSAQRDTFAQLADQLIPAGDEMPAASQADVSTRWLDAVLEARPELADDLLRLLELAAARPAADVVGQLPTTHPDLFAVLTEIVPNAYFMNPDVRAAVGYAGQDQRPIDPRADYMEDGLLESVIRRGPIYRDHKPVTKNR